MQRCSQQCLPLVCEKSTEYPCRRLRGNRLDPWSLNKPLWTSDGKVERLVRFPLVRVLPKDITRLLAAVWGGKYDSPFKHAHYQQTYRKRRMNRIISNRLVWSSPIALHVDLGCANPECTPCEQRTQLWSGQPSNATIQELRPGSYGQSAVDSAKRDPEGRSVWWILFVSPLLPLFSAFCHDPNNTRSTYPLVYFLY